MEFNVDSTFKKLGRIIKFVPDTVIGERIACYNVIYDGKNIKPKASDRLDIPVNEIWISDKYKNDEKAKTAILFHEYKEIQHRRAGDSEEIAHQKARRDEKLLHGI